MNTTNISFSELVKAVSNGKSLISRNTLILTIHFTQLQSM